MKRELVIDVESQTARLYEGRRLKEVFSVSTAKKGLGSAEGSNCTPTGTLRVAEKIGGGMPLGTIFKDRVATGMWDGRKREGESLILTRILWLEGREPANKNTKERFIYLHGTSHEDKLGTPNSQGCIVFSSRDIVKVYDALKVGDVVKVVAPKA
jgi:lipoprotein-anchoring transpeptidase ErfK/SrfK